MQVTRLKCNSFIFAVRLNHTISDATDLVEFMTGVGKMAHKASALTTFPVWCQKLQNAHD